MIHHKRLFYLVYLVCILFSQSCTANVLQLTNALTKLQEKLGELKGQLLQEPREGAKTDRGSFFKQVMGINESIFLDLYCDKPEVFARDAGKTIALMPDEKTWEQNHVNYLKRFIQKRGNNFYIQQYVIKPLNKPTDDPLVATGKEFCAGYFEELSIKALREKTKNLPKPGKGTFNVIMRASGEYDKCVDVAALQADIEYRDAVFQAASQFNAYEATSAYAPDDPTRGGVTDFIHDWTQGPGAAISGAPGTILRVYYVFYDENTDPVTWRQTTDHQVDFLSDVKDKIVVINGYTNFPASQKKNPTLDFTEEDYVKIKVGFHHNVQVVRGYGNAIPINDSKQIIHQVFTAAAALGGYAVGVDTKQAKNIATKILEAAYEGTIRSAILFNKKRVFLTLIGGGVFANNPAWIIGAIEKTIDLIRDYGLDVYLVVYSREKLISNWGDNLIKTEDKRLFKMVTEKEKNKGTYTLHSEENPEGTMITTEEQLLATY